MFVKIIYLFFSLFLLFLISFQNILASEIGEKFEVSILDASESKRTILLNRGLSSGLTIEEHANFYDDLGPIAKGVAIKVSPMRSVWALYTVENATKISPNTQIKIKISAPVKLTVDQSKMIRPAIALSDQQKFSTSRDAGVFFDKLSPEIKDEFEKKQKEETKNRNVPFVERAHEFWGILDFSFFNTSLKREGSRTEASSSLSLNYKIGYEYYLDKFIKQLSLDIFFKEEYGTYLTGNSQKTRLNFLEFGVGPNWHFYNDPMLYGEVIAFTYFHFGGGLIDSKAISTDSNGTTSTIAIGVGGKYYLSSGIGLRLILEYSYSNRYFIVDSIAQNEAISGVKSYIGFSYRF